VKKAKKIGGENTFPLHFFEGSLPNPPGLGLEVLDMQPENWPTWALDPFEDVVSDPVEWAKKGVEEYGAEILCLRLLSTDPMGMDVAPEEAAKTVRKVVDSLNIPLIVLGDGSGRQGLESFDRGCPGMSGKNLLLGPALKGNYQEIAKAALEHGHAIVAQASMDANLTKELNIALCKFFPPEKIVVDPTSSALGYGMEYTFSIIESIKQFGLVDKDNMMQMPIFADIGIECWKNQRGKGEVKTRVCSGKQPPA